jgi:hypothetical protein
MRFALSPSLFHSLCFIFSNDLPRHVALRSHDTQIEYYDLTMYIPFAAPAPAPGSQPSELPEWVCHRANARTIVTPRADPIVVTNGVDRVWILGGVEPRPNGKHIEHQTIEEYRPAKETIRLLDTKVPVGLGLPGEGTRAQQAAYVDGQILVLVDDDGMRTFASSWSCTLRDSFETCFFLSSLSHHFLYQSMFSMSRVSSGLRRSPPVRSTFHVLRW